MMHKLYILLYAIAAGLPFFLVTWMTIKSIRELLLANRKIQPTPSSTTGNSSFTPLIVTSNGYTVPVYKIPPDVVIPSRSGTVPFNNYQEETNGL